MRICIPTVDDRGLDAQPSDHFGSAPYFTIVETDSGKCEALANGGHGHGGSCTPLALLGPARIEAVACRGMGHGARAGLEHAGIRVLVAQGDCVSDVVEALRSGALQPLSPDQACGGHQHGKMEGQGGCQRHGD
jgi:predicted Fe-Mo cluster-binding NifX family protein